MNIPRFWAPATEVSSSRGRELALVAWGWSTTGRAEAEQRARERLAGVVQRVRQGLDLPRGYAYGDRPLREEIVLEHRDDAGVTTAIVTRNGYGALVLNTASALFIDVDLPPVRAAGALSRLFGRRDTPNPEDAALPPLREALRAAGGRFRIYRTGADPAYLQLCRVQQSFRARLTPKPWRCGQRMPPGAHPREHADDQAEFARWIADYERASRPNATCRFVESVAGDDVAPAVRPILDLHDDVARVAATLPLA